MILTAPPAGNVVVVEEEVVTVLEVVVVFVCVRDVVVERGGDLDDPAVLGVQLEVAADPAVGAHRAGDPRRGGEHPGA